MASKLLSLCLTGVSRVIQSPSFIGYLFPETLLIRGVIEVAGISNRSYLFSVLKYVELLILTSRWSYHNVYLFRSLLGVGCDLISGHLKIL
jgi:hypothetical protein